MLSVVYLLLSLTSVISYGVLLLIGFDPWLEWNYLTHYSDGGVLLFLYTTLLFVFGSTLVEMFIGCNTQMPTYGKVARIELMFKYRILKFITTSIYFLVVISPLVYGFDIFYRHQYQFGNDPGAIEELLQKLVELILAFGPSFHRFFREGSSVDRYASRILLLFSTLVLYGVSTKLAGVAVMAYSLTGHLSDNSWLRSVFVGLCGVIVMALTLHQRDVGIYGIFSIFDVLVSFFNDPIVILGFPFQVVASTIFITSETVGRTVGSLDMFYTEINPLPGFLTNWYDIYQFMRVNEAIPFNAIGTVFAISPLLVVVFGGMAAISVVLLRRILVVLGVKYDGVIAVLFSIFISASISQYNLRGSMRILYYVVLLWVIFRLYCYLREGNAYERS